VDSPEVTVAEVTLPFARSQAPQPSFQADRAGWVPPSEDAP
jgi:hypothetical protein